MSHPPSQLEDEGNISLLLSACQLQFYCVEIRSKDATQIETETEPEPDPEPEPEPEPEPGLRERVYAAEALAQHYVTYVRTSPSDESDFEDTTYEQDLAWAELKRQRKLRHEAHQRQVAERRQQSARRYFLQRVTDDSSIFNQPGVEFLRYTHQYIKLKFTPATLYKGYIGGWVVYSAVIVYKRFGRTRSWTMRSAQAPCRQQLYELFQRTLVTDEELVATLWAVYQLMKEQAHEDARRTQDKHQRLLTGDHVELNSDEEVLLLPEEEVARRRRHREAVWSRMQWPEHLTPGNFRLD